MRTKRAALAALLILTALSGCAQAQPAGTSTSTSKDWSTSTTNTETAPPLTKIQQALAACKLSMGTDSIGDSGHTVTLRWGKETTLTYGPRELDTSDVKCVLDATGMPSAYWQQIGQTRALDGMQHASWGPYKATWTFHPDDGANLILTDNL
ncbi:hypothetical protein J2W21_003010 [Sinomonas atrocyanea]|uniref:hypothetical protein n=1 Tax=Sinomonas atrocyanea TaxID=37927 RepID=UPI002785E2A4|nr:hypothetical protein [Sinomonas atrocyanea]MDP9885487.1 hypothetical protein [Sinomonas atrocyanea]